MTSHNRNTQVIEEYEITENLKVTVSVTFDEEKVFFDANYMDGKYTIQKSFSNNYIGLHELSIAKQEFNSEEAFKKYLGL